MVVADWIRAALFLLLVIPMPTWLILTLVFVAGCAGPPFEAARSASLPHAVPSSEYPAAIALTSATYQMAIIAGALAGGGLVSIIGPRAAIAVNAISFAASAAVLAHLSVGIAVPTSGTRIRIRDGARPVWEDLYVRRAIVLIAGMSGAGVVVEALVPAFVEGELAQGGWLTGAMLATIAAGNLLTGAAFAARRPPEIVLRVCALIGLVGGLLALVGFARALDVPLIAVSFFAVGIVFGSAVPANGLIGVRIPDRVRASAFGVLSGVLQGVCAAAAALGGLAAALLGVSATCAVAAGIAILLAAWSLAFPVRTPATTPPSS
jgi:predicted MFS family arabinose efflux permease